MTQRVLQRTTEAELNPNVCDEVSLERGTGSPRAGLVDRRVLTGSLVLGVHVIAGVCTAGSDVGINNNQSPVV